VSAQHARRRAEKKAEKEKEKLNVVLKVETPIVNDLAELQKPLITLKAATDDQLVEELKRRGYTGDIIRKQSFIL
jgi:hypothetical protein